jgi:hypothetical protein
LRASVAGASGCYPTRTTRPATCARTERAGVSLAIAHRSDSQGQSRRGRKRPRDRSRHWPRPRLSGDTPRCCVDCLRPLTPIGQHRPRPGEAGGRLHLVQRQRRRRPPITRAVDDPVAAAFRCRQPDCRFSRARERNRRRRCDRNDSFAAHRPATRYSLRRRNAYAQARPPRRGSPALPGAPRPRIRRPTRSDACSGRPSSTW